MEWGTEDRIQTTGLCYQMRGHEVKGVMRGGLTVRKEEKQQLDLNAASGRHLCNSQVHGGPSRAWSMDEALSPMAMHVTRHETGGSLGVEGLGTTAWFLYGSPWEKGWVQHHSTPHLGPHDALKPLTKVSCICLPQVHTGGSTGL